MSTPTDIELRLKEKLDQRIQDSSNRSLDLPLQHIHGPPLETSNHHHELLDFSSNDYLGLANSKKQQETVESKYKAHTSKHPPPHLGSTGSRLLSGNSSLALGLETFLATVHNRPAALLCNSGYDANLSLLSSLPLPDDVIIMDDLVHNSLIMGVRMSRIPSTRVYFFRHNDFNDLERVLSEVTAKMTREPPMKRCIFVVIESVYSMDGDISPVEEILNLSLRYKARVVVDEAHGLGVFGHTNRQDMKKSIALAESKYNTDASNSMHNSTTHIVHQCGGTGVLAALNLEHHPALLAGVFTFGKAAGCHGAVITGSKVLIDYLVNYARPFIYSTSLPSHSLCAIKCSYDVMIGDDGERLRRRVFHLVSLFRSSLLDELDKCGDFDASQSFLLPSPTPIQAVLCRGNENCIRMANLLRRRGHIMVYPIRSPTVAKSEERIRIIIHAHNTEGQVLHLVKSIMTFKKELALASKPRSGLVSASPGVIRGHAQQESMTRSKL
jgi:8-amino-7-oxononanoate synthase